MEGECYDEPPRPSSASLSGPFPCPCTYGWNRHTWHLAQSHSGREQLTQGKRPWIWERLRTGGEAGTKDETVGWYYWLKGHEFEQSLGESEGRGSLACCSPWGHKESNTSDWTYAMGPWPVGWELSKQRASGSSELSPLLDETVSQYQYFILKRWQMLMPPLKI